MIGGPVFHFELVRIARRWQFYALRGGFGLVLLLILGYYFLTFQYGAIYWLENRQTLTLKEMAEFGAWVFGTLMAAQTALVLGLTPALAAGAIADERRRKTLAYVLSSRLTGGEIVLGKLAARLLHIGLFLAIVLPIVSLLTLLGGVDPMLLVWTDAATLSSAFFLASASILASIVAGRVREAVVLAYAIEGLWLFGPLAVRGLSPSGAWWLEINWYFEASNPIGLFEGLWRPGQFWGQYAWMVGLQLAAGTLLTLLAIWRLRPAFKAHEGRSLRSLAILRWQFRLLPRPPVGERAVYWKEVHVARTAGIVRLLLLIATLGLGGLLGYWSVVYAKAAIQEALANGLFPSTEIADRASRAAREDFNGFLRFVGCALGALWMLALAGSAASRFSAEREMDTWTSLLATPLEGHEIVRGKMLGTLRATAWIGVVIGLHWLLGLATGAIHPFWLGIATIELASGAWFALALGTFISLRSRSTWRAQALALGILIAPNLCCMLQVLPSPLYQVGFSLMGYSDSAEFVKMFAKMGDLDYRQFEWWMPIIVVGLFTAGFAAYTSAAYLLTFGTFRGFDDVAERPRRWFGRPAPLDPKEAQVTEAPFA